MLGFSVGQLAKLATALVSGDENLIEKLIEKKLESLGEDFLMQLIGGPLSTAHRVSRAVETGGASEFNRLRNEWLGALKPQTSFTGSRVLKVFEKALLEGKEGFAHGQKWGKTDWATSRKDWLDNKWRHDWRSQPRDRAGRWIPGRLDYIPEYQRGKLRALRRMRRYRRLRRERRRIARGLARQMVRDWNE